MNADFTAEELAFESEVREFLSAEFPGEYRDKVDANIRLSKDELVNWQKILYRKGWAAPNWPQEYGGTGWSATQNYIFATEMGLIGAPEPVPFGMKMVAPVIMAFGDAAQKKHYLPRILSSEDWWCQGYSEPGSGSDLAFHPLPTDDPRDAPNVAALWPGSDDTYVMLIAHYDHLRPRRSGEDRIFNGADDRLFRPHTRFGCALESGYGGLEQGILRRTFS